MHPNIVTFLVHGDYALFSDPVTRIGGEKCTYQIPTYEALKGILMSVYWKPTFIWYIDKVRVLKPIQTEVKSARRIFYSENKADRSYYTYLKDCAYEVQAHFEWNENRPELIHDRDENKHHQIAKRRINTGGRRDAFLGTRECQAYVEPCDFGKEKGAYDNLLQLHFGLMYHGITYADEQYSEETKGKMTVNMWYPVMENGVIKFLRPEECPIHKTIRSMEMKQFVDKENFIGLKEFEAELEAEK